MARPDPGLPDPFQPSENTDDAPSEGLEPTPARPALRPESTAGAILMAAMLGLADGIGFERPKQETVQVASADGPANDLKLDFDKITRLNREGLDDLDDSSYYN